MSLVDAALVNVPIAKDHNTAVALSNPRGLALLSRRDPIVLSLDRIGLYNALTFQLLKVTILVIVIVTNVGQGGLSIYNLERWKARDIVLG
jgi:hypothetical protein